MVHFKSDGEIEIMRKGGALSKVVLDFALSQCIDGISTLEIDKKVTTKIAELGLTSWYPDADGYPFSICISVNDEWLHGNPTDYVLRRWDLVSVDIGVRYKGYCLDNCWTVVVGDNHKDVRLRTNHKDEKITHFLETGVRALDKAIKKAIIGNRIGDISYPIEKKIERNGYSVMEDYAGHGIGKKHWEEPSVPCFGKKGKGLLLEKGMVLAIEPMYAMGSSDNVMRGKWTVATKDGNLSAMFEHTVAITEKGPLILTN